MRLIATFIFLLPLGQYCSSQNLTDSTRVKHHWDIFYTDKKDTLQSLDVYWNNSTQASNVLLFVHGGDWLSGDKNLYREMASNLARNGITVVLINYRLSPPVRFPAHAEDVAAAIHWTFSFIDQYHGDRKHIYLMGHSAGAHLISLLLCDDTYLGKHELMPKDIAGAITLSGVFDIKPQEGGATKKYLGMVFGDDEKIWQNASCKNHIDTMSKYKIPPFLISWCQEESILIVDESLNFIEELKASEIPLTPHSFNSTDHYAFKQELMDTTSTLYVNLLQFMGN
jgi:acetyl esterase/lipase